MGGGAEFRGGGGDGGRELPARSRWERGAPVGRVPRTPGGAAGQTRRRGAKRLLRARTGGAVPARRSAGDFPGSGGDSLCPATPAVRQPPPRVLTAKFLELLKMGSCITKKIQVPGDRAPVTLRPDEDAGVEAHVGELLVPQAGVGARCHRQHAWPCLSSR